MGRNSPKPLPPLGICSPLPGCWNRPLGIGVAVLALALKSGRICCEFTGGADFLGCVAFSDLDAGVLYSSVSGCSTLKLGSRNGRASILICFKRRTTGSSSDSGLLFDSELPWKNSLFYHALCSNVHHLEGLPIWVYPFYSHLLPSNSPGCM
jgi:hypothetical protein